jgi:hypothetical protein
MIASQSDAVLVGSFGPEAGSVQPPKAYKVFCCAVGHCRGDQLRIRTVMKNSKVLIAASLVGLTTMLLFCPCASALEKDSGGAKQNGYRQGLVGAWYEGDDLTRIGDGMKISSLDETWGANRGHGNDWSGQWEGFITARVTGEVTFYGECNKEFIVEIADKRIIHIQDNKGQNSGSVEMMKGEKYPIKVKYLQHTGGTGHFRVMWSWSGKEKVLVPSDSLGFTAEQAEHWNYIERPDPAAFDFGSLKTIPVENYVAYGEPGRFGGWPANNGVWIWGNEIVVGFEQGYHDPQPSGGHAIRRDKPQLNVLSRSLDGGRTWRVEDLDNFVGDEVDEDKHVKDCPGVDFAHPDFAMRVGGSRFFVSYDRGKTWEGPYRVVVTGEKVGKLTSRTDYIVKGPKECLVFMSAETGLVESNYQDRAFCARTTDGGRSFEFQGWMTHDVEVRSVMPSTAYVGDKHLVSVMRRKHEQTFEGRPSITKNWIEAAESKDDGKTWVSLGKVADTDLGDRNGNPPAMVRLKDGRLCVAYGYRGFPYGIRIKLSSDNAKTWGDEIALRTDGGTWDLGYPRMVQRPDGKVVTIYYFNTKEVPAQHIAATIWDPSEVK